MHFEDQNAALSAILNNGVEDVEAAFSTLSPAELKQLEMSVKKLKMQAKVPGGNINSSGMPVPQKLENGSPPACAIVSRCFRWTASYAAVRGKLFASRNERHDDHGLLLHGHHHQLLDMGHLQDPSLQSPLEVRLLCLQCR